MNTLSENNAIYLKAFKIFNMLEIQVRIQWYTPNRVVYIDINKIPMNPWHRTK